MEIDEKKFIFKIGQIEFVLDDVGEAMNMQFLKQYESHYLKTSFDPKKFYEEMFIFFNSNKDKPEKHDSFFNNLTIMWQELMKQGHYSYAENLWKNTLNVIRQYEINSKNRIHKGTLYGFWSATCIIKGDLENGFLLMHKALEEDKETNRSLMPNTAAYAFVTLDYQKEDNFFKPKIDTISKFLESKLNEYRIKRNGELLLGDLKKKFLEESSLREVVFYFVYTLFHLEKLLDKTDQELMKSSFGSLFQTNVIFDLCLIVDKVIEYKNPTEWEFSKHLQYLSKTTVLNFNRQETKKVNTAFDSNFTKTLETLLHSKYTFSNSVNLQPIEEDFAITYGFRNRAAHKIEHQSIIHDNFQEISQRLFNSLFFVIEKLY